MGPSPQTPRRGLRKRVIPLHYQKKSSLNQSHSSSGKKKLTRCDQSNNNRSLALALQEARIDLARKNDQIMNFKHLRAQVELCIPIFENTLLELKEALKETYEDSRHSANNDADDELYINKIAEEKPPSTDTCKEKLLNLHNKPIISKSVEVQEVPTNALYNGDGSRSILRSIETISESPEKMNSLQKAPKLMLSKIPTLNVSSSKSALKRKNTETLTSEKNSLKEISKNHSLKLRNDNPKVKDFKIIRRETFVIPSADKKDCEINIQHDSEPETVSEIVLNNSSDQGKVLNEIEKFLISSNYDKRKTFVVSSVVGGTPELHLDKKHNQNSSIVSELLQAKLQEIKLGDKAPSSTEFIREPGLKESFTSNDSKERTIVDHSNLEQEKFHLHAKQNIESESGVVVTNVVSPSAASSVQNTVDTKCLKANLSPEKAQHSAQKFPSEYSTKQKYDKDLSEQRIVKDMQPVDCFLDFQENVHSKTVTKTRRSLRLKRTDVATRKSEYFFPRLSKRKSLVVESAEQMYQRKCRHNQIIQDVTMQQQGANISEENMQTQEIKSPISLVKTLEQNSLQNDDHKGSIREGPEEEVMHLNEQCNQMSLSVSELLQTTFQEAELELKSPFSVKIKSEPGLKEDFTSNDPKEQIIVDLPNLNQEKYNLPTEQSTENESEAVKNIIPQSAASSEEKLVDTKCCKANLPLEKTQSSVQNVLTAYSTKQRSDQLLVEDMPPVDCLLEFHENVDSKKLKKVRQSLRHKRTDVAAKKTDFFPLQNERSPLAEKTEQTHHHKCRYDQLSQDVTMQLQESNLSEKNMQMQEVKYPISLLEQNSLQNDDHKGDTMERSGEKVCDKLKKINEELDILLNNPATVTPPFRGQIKCKPEKKRYNFCSRISFARKQNKKVSIGCKKFLSEQTTISSVGAQINFVKSVEAQNTQLDNNTLFLRNGTSEEAEKLQMHSTVENDMQNANGRVASRRYLKTAQVKASNTKHETQIDSKASQIPENQIDVKSQLSDDSFVVGNYIDGNDGLPSIHPFSLHSLERNSTLPAKKMVSKGRRKTKVKKPKENIKNDLLDCLMQGSTVKTEHQEDIMEAQVPHTNNTLISKNIQLDCKDMPNKKYNKVLTCAQISLQDDVCLLSGSNKIKSQKIPINDTFSNEKHSLNSNLNHPICKNSFTRQNKIKKKNHRTSSIVNGQKSKKVGNELKFKNMRKSSRSLKKLGALKELNVSQKFEMHSEMSETTVPSDVLISKNLKLSKSVKNVSTADWEIKCDSEKVNSVSNRLTDKQSTVTTQSQNNDKNHPTPSRETKPNSFIVNKSLSPCVVHLVDEIVECEVDPKQCNQKDCMLVKKKRVKPKKGKKHSNILKENVKPQSTKTLGKDQILTVADIHEPPLKTPNCEKNVMTDMQPSVVLNDIMEESKFSKVNIAPSTDRNISASHDVPVLLHEKNSERKILPEAIEPSGILSRRTRKPVNYKEPSVVKKLRR